MAIQIPYGEHELAISIPPDRLLGVLRPAEPRPLDPAKAIRSAALHPLDRPALRDFARPGEPVLVIINDATRPTPTAVMLEALWEEISRWDLSFLVATGTHRPPSRT